MTETIQEAVAILAEKQAALAVLSCGWHPYTPGGGLELKERIIDDLRNGTLSIDEPVSQDTVYAYADEMDIDPGFLPKLEPTKARAS